MTAAAERTVLLSCGEASGDVYLARVARSLRERHPEWRLVGVVGEQGRAAGVEPWGDLSELTVMGFAEVLAHLPRLRNLARRLVDRARAEGVDLFLPVDYPGFHVHVGKRMRRHGVPVLDFIPPKTWSWGRWRLRGLRRAVDRAAVIFPFEEEHYRTAGIDVRFVGHPLAEIHAAAMEDAPERDDSVLLVPGSRPQEIQRLTPVLVEAFDRWEGRSRAGRVRISRAPTVPVEALRAMRDGIEGAEIVDLPLFAQLQRCRWAVVCSGTATVEAALAGVPHCIVYRTGRISYGIARWLATVEHIGMANIVLGRRAFPELVQDDCRPDRLRPLFERLDSDSELRAGQAEASRELRAALGGPGVFDAVAELATEMLGD